MFVFIHSIYYIDYFNYSALVNSIAIIDNLERTSAQQVQLQLLW